MMTRPEQIDLLPQWQQALDRLLARPGVTVILGAPDTGKSTLTKVVVQAFQQAGQTVGWVDGDVGQSDLGPPTTIGMKIVTPSTDVEGDAHAEALRFVGAVSPSGHLLPVVVGALRMVRLARARGAHAIVMNTSGMVHGGAARALNLSLIDVIGPDYVLALQRASEIEHLLRPIERQAGRHVVRLPVSDRAKRWSLDERRAVRQEGFRRYFEAAKSLTLSVSEVSFQHVFLGTGVQLSEDQLTDASAALDTGVVYGERAGDGLYLVVTGPFRGQHLDLMKEAWSVERIYILPQSDFDHRLVGLCDAANDLLALGLLEQMDWRNGRLFLLTPLGSLDHVTSVQFGSLRVDRSGQEHWLG